MKNYLILFSILILGFFVRFYNFSDRITFGPEQAISLSTSAKMINEKISLLGIENVQRFTSTGLQIHSGVLFSYLLIPVLLLFKYNPVSITVLFALLNIFTAFILYIVIKKITNYKIALLSIFLFTFNSYMIYHSEFIWILNFMPLIGVGILYAIFNFLNNNDTISVLIIGILSGIGFSFEYVFLFTALIIFLICIYISKHKLKHFVWFIVGTIIPNLPMIVFDIKHDFYHLRTLFLYTIDVLNHNATAGFTYYHYLHLWPFIMLLGGIFLSIIFQRNKLLSYLILIVYLVVNLSSDKINFNYPTGMSKGLNIRGVNESSRLISELSGSNFNVVTLQDFDTRGHILRYYLNYVYNKYPKGVVEYKDVDEIYALALNGYDFESKTNPWELNVFKPYKVERIGIIGEDYSVFKLTK